VAVKFTEVAPDGTVTEAPGTGRKALLLDNDTGAPPGGAASLNVTVQLVVVPEFKLLGLHTSDVKTADAVKLMLAVLETPESVAVRVAL
jgi:hypothetical protein